MSDEDDTILTPSTPDEASTELGSMFAQFLKSNNITERFALDDDNTEDEEDDSETMDTLVDLDDDLSEDDDDADEYSAESTITDEQFNQELDTNVKERMLSSPQALIDLNFDVDMDLDEEDLDYGDGSGRTIYKVPEKYPDSNLSAGEVVQLRELFASI